MQATLPRKQTLVKRLVVNTQSGVQLQSIARMLGLSDTGVLVPEAWAASQASLPAAPLDSLQEAFVRKQAAYCSLPEQAVESLLAAAARLDADAAARAMFHHLLHVQYVLDRDTANWPKLDAMLSADAGAFYLLGLLAGIARTQGLHAELGIPANIVRDTMSDVARHAARYRAQTSRWGLDPLYVGGWLRNHQRGKLYCLGRLQFIAQRFDSSFMIFRHGESRAVCTMMMPGKTLRSDGQFNGAGGVTQTCGLWQTTLTMSDTTITGHRVDPTTGTVERTPVQLERAQWTQVLGAGDTCLDIHIPTGGALTFEDCGASMRQAMTFFPRYFPGPVYRVLTCTSWFLDAQWQNYLKADSNIVRFMREGYLRPTSSDGWAGFRSIYDMDIDYGFEGTPDFSKCERTTSLQRALFAHMENGGRWRKAGWFILCDEFDWGSQRYWRQDRMRCGPT